MLKAAQAHSSRGPVGRGQNHPQAPRVRGTGGRVGGGRAQRRERLTPARLLPPGPLLPHMVHPRVETRAVLVADKELELEA
jgi:hypothetical protein